MGSLYDLTDEDSCDDLGEEGPTVPIRHTSGSQRGKGESKEN